MEIRRGDIVIVTAAGDFGKPRPAVVVQTDVLNATHGSVLVCLVTSDLTDSPAFRLHIAATSLNGLRLPSQIMADRVFAYRRDRIRGRIGALSQEQMNRLDAALAFVLGLPD